MSKAHPVSARTMRALERAAMRMVDRNGWLREPRTTRSKQDARRRDEFEEAVANHAAARKKERK